MPVLALRVPCVTPLLLRFGYESCRPDHPLPGEGALRVRGPEGADYHSSPIIRAELVDLFRHGLHSSWSAKMPKAGAGFFPITSTVGKEFFLLGDEGRVVSSAEERGGDLERRVPQHEDGWIPPRGMCFLHTHARPVLLDDSILCGILPVVPCVRAGCHERAQVGEGPPETEGERRAHLHVHLDAQSVYGDHGRPHGRSTRGWFHAW